MINIFSIELQIFSDEKNFNGVVFLGIEYMVIRLPN